MDPILRTVVFLTVTHVAISCAPHSRRSVYPQTFVGTVAQACTPGNITSAAQLKADPTKCNLKLTLGCDLCGLRLYKAETTTARFLIQPMDETTFLQDITHVHATDCKCERGCFFHHSSITQFGIEPLPTGTDGNLGGFSEPFACFSGSITPVGRTKPVDVFQTWCESDGGCPNHIVARYAYLTRAETGEPDRPQNKGVFTPHVATLGAGVCQSKHFSEKIDMFMKGLRGGNGIGKQAVIKLPKVKKRVLKEKMPKKMTPKDGMKKGDMKSGGLKGKFSRKSAKAFFQCVSDCVATGSRKIDQFSQKAAIEFRNCVSDCIVSNKDDNSMHGITGMKDMAKGPSNKYDGKKM